MLSLVFSSASLNAFAEQSPSQKSDETSNYAITQTSASEDNNRDQLAEYSKAQLEQMLAPIALYPDSLLTHILIAATYPLEVVQAERWLVKMKKRKLSAEELLKLVKEDDWDPSVQALIPFPNVVERMSSNLDWTQQLGEAFLQNEASVLESIQSLRNKALDAGNLTQMDNVTVSYEDSNIIIQPIERKVIYVPYYDTRVIYGNWHWRHHQPVYWVNRHHHYKPYHGLFSWNSGVHLSVNVLFGAFHWRDHHVVVHHRDHRSIYQYTGYRHTSYDRPAKRWQHDRKHRRGVVYRNVNLNRKLNKVHHNAHKNTYSNLKNRHQNVMSSIDNRKSIDKHHRIKTHFGVTKAKHHKVESTKKQHYGATNKKRVHNNHANLASPPKLYSANKNQRSIAESKPNVNRYKQSRNTVKAKREHDKANKPRLVRQKEGKPKKTQSNKYASNRKVSSEHKKNHRR